MYQNPTGRMLTTMEMNTFEFKSKNSSILNHFVLFFRTLKPFLCFHQIKSIELCSGAIQGFKIAIQPPNEEPQLWKNFFYISPGRTALIKVTPKLTITSHAVRKYSPKTRQCFFNAERQLRFYKCNSRFLCTFSNV